MFHKYFTKRITLHLYSSYYYSLGGNICWPVLFHNINLVSMSLEACPLDSLPTLLFRLHSQVTAISATRT